MLASSGAAAAIAYLNGGVPHRYTAACRIDGDVLHNVLLHDKQGRIRPEALAAVPMRDSFCQFVLRDAVLCTDDAAADMRLDGHACQGVAICYHGVPVMSSRGELWGTLCHFDTVPIELSDEEFELLQRAARSFPAYLAGT
ncbi:hypothetical protein ASF43_05090 [Pseudorhodoferax sp. Leaf267]|nr:hypothetical protein ASF43_05090 [Pseudorhodoferax sp. Leaf267]